MKYRKSIYEVRIQRLNESPAPIDLKLDHPAALWSYWKEAIVPMPWFDPERELCVAILLTTRFAPLGHNLVGIGSVNECVVHPREVFRPAVAMGAYAVALIHNHPSGDSTPSQSDHSVTRRLKEAGDLLQIRFLDHLIVGTGGQVHTAMPPYYSFKEAGVL